MKLCKRICSLCLAGLLTLGLTAPALADTSPFPDVAAGHWAAGEITAAARAGLFLGDQQGRFLPADSLNRGSFVTVLCRMFGWELTAPTGAVYTDCPSSAWYTAAAETAAAHGVGEGSAAFRPNHSITREEIAVMLVQALGYENLAQRAASAGLESKFSDLSPSHPHFGHILVAYQIGLTNGIQEGDKLLFKPNGTASRAEAAAMVMRVQQRYAAENSWLHGFYAISSYSQLELAGQMDAVSVGWAAMTLDADGQPMVVSDNTNGNPWVLPEGHQEVRDYLAQRNIPCNLNVYLDASMTAQVGGETVRVADLLRDPSRAGEMTAPLVEAAADYDGLTIDFEGLQQEHRTAFSALLTQLSAALPEGKLLYVCVPPDQWYKGYDYGALSAPADKLILMAHDFDWATPDYYIGTQNTDNPPAGLPQVYTALARVLSQVSDPSKVALQLCMDSVGLPIDDNGAIRSTQIVHPTPETLFKRLGQPDTATGWSDQYATSWANYTTEDGRWLVWYEDGGSAAAKAQLARMMGIGGLSLWRLGTIPTYDQFNYNVWKALHP